ncbi:hypothetical protein [Spirochaeta cellobiosiphila]|uniref:hypothetical protein n=1 Tax=Spirochaeta cellobiosiphila TaxID=504483 RepID=UPI00040732E9|nr:hypothetical protein [Spirochaeta cellobiosiphila]
MKWKWIDFDHIDAHASDFVVPLNELLSDIEERMDNWASHQKDTQEALWFHDDLYLDKDCGYTGLGTVDRADTKSFWAYRKNRSIPSHLMLGDKVLTSTLCLWGYLLEDVFYIHTLYPGQKAPREIHDPQLKLEEIDESLQFWTKHAIIVSEGEYTFESSE